MKVVIASKRTLILATAVLLSAVMSITFASKALVRKLNNSGERKHVDVIIDAGHGGEDGGAVGVDGIVEKHINLEISKDLHDICHLLGISSIMIREKDKALYDSSAKTLRQKKISDLRNRILKTKENSTPETIFVSVHQNKFPDSKYSGTQVYYSPNNPKSEELADCIRLRVVSMIQNENKREIKESPGAFLLKNIEIPSVIVECGFISNEEEAKKLTSEMYQSQMALSIFCGINDFLLKEKSEG
ncbi:MAG: N-acetylmuramoyl-L-alanine amidase [Oscillospiraceae bacterium]|jgi:N-acetylmuramoyl-L-alanine amidase|nr:N-acetylmuramoyl-L-alanine amidase [Oscillospiraceae bacterium]